jgi:hypothetical protein
MESIFDSKRFIFKLLNGRFFFTKVQLGYVKIKFCLILIAFILLCSGCYKEKKETKLPLKYQCSVLGGCYNNYYAKSIEIDSNDTVTFSIENDTLILHYGLHYNCCARLSNTVLTNENRIIIEVTNKSADVCKCYCYYSSDFKFTNFQTGTYTYKILFKALPEAKSEIFKEGSVYVIKQ